MTKRHIFAALGALSALVLPAAPAAAEAWRVIHISPVVAPFGRSLAYVDADAVVREGDEVSFVYDIRFLRDGVIVGLRTPARASCSAYWYELGGTISYQNDQATGESAPEPRRESEPGSNIQLVIEAVCSGAYLSGPVDIMQHAREFTAQ